LASSCVSRKGGLARRAVKAGGVGAKCRTTSDRYSASLLLTACFARFSVLPFVLHTLGIKMIKVAPAGRLGWSVRPAPLEEAGSYRLPK
jgi:hypothetical protein